MTDHAEEVWAWLREPIQQLAQTFDDRPDATWDERVAELLQQLGLLAPDGHPVAHALLYHLESLDDARRREFLTSSEAENYARDVANAQVVDEAPEEAPEQAPEEALAEAPEEAPETYDVEGPDEAALRQLADQAYHWVVEQLTAEDPGFPEQLARDPELARAIYAEAAQRIGVTPAG